MDKYCCDTMKFAVNSVEVPLNIIEKFGEYGISIQDGGSSRLTLNFCPWCGTKLPKSERDRWFDELEAAGIDPHVDEIPAIYLDGTWLKSKK